MNMNLTFRARSSMALLLSFALIGGASLTASAGTDSAFDVAPEPVRTIFLSRCNGPRLSTDGTNCNGFDGTEIRNNPDVFVVGFENNAEMAEKHVLQVVAVYDLSSINPEPDQVISGASLRYGEYSTVHRSAGGDAEYGILRTCVTNLGVPVAGDWDGSTNQLIQTTPAQVGGHVPATTGDSGTWDITPQLRTWLNAGKKQGTLVLRGDDESPDIHAQAMCLSYVGELVIAVQLGPRS
jgi:hypothetical protein